MNTILPFFLAMITAIVLLNMLANKLKIAYPILLVIGGLCISFIPSLPMISINPDMIFFLFLPPLLFTASWSVSFKEMKKWWRIIGSFAFLVVFFTAISVAIVANMYIPGFTLTLGLLLGGIVSPPDAVSTAAITKFVKIQKSTSNILQGESLLNDASSLIIFHFALLAVSTGHFFWQQATLSFLWTIIGGLGLGWLAGWIFVQINKKLPTDAPSDIILGILEPYFLYWMAEQVHASGVLSVVAGGLYMSSQRFSYLNSDSRIKGSSVWESLEFLLNGIVFFVIGLELPAIVDGLHKKGIPISKAIGYGVLVTVVLILARIISSYMALLATMIFRPKVLPRTSSNKSRLLTPLVLGWTGMRGVVSLAAALTIPAILKDGTNFPQRNLILFITFVCILLTLLVQGLTLPYLIKKFFVVRMASDEPEKETEAKIKHGLRGHVLQYLKDKNENENEKVDQALMNKVLNHWEEKSKKENEGWLDDSSKQLYFDILEAQRKYLADLNTDPDINEEMIRKQLYQIDLEEERLKMI